jgi:hypothetical protein
MSSADEIRAISLFLSLSLSHTHTHTRTHTHARAHTRARTHTHAHTHTQIDRQTEASFLGGNLKIDFVPRLQRFQSALCMRWDTTFGVDSSGSGQEPDARSCKQDNRFRISALVDLSIVRSSCWYMTWVVQWLKLAFSKELNRVDVSLSSPEEGSSKLPKRCVF